MPDYSNNFTGIQNPNAPSSPAAQKTFDSSNLSALFSGLASFWTSYDAAKSQGGLVSAPPAPAPNKTWTYVGYGLIAVAVLGIIIFAITKK